MGATYREENEENSNEKTCTSTHLVSQFFQAFSSLFEYFKGWASLFNTQMSKKKEGKKYIYIGWPKSFDPLLNHILTFAIIHIFSQFFIHTISITFSFGIFYQNSKRIKLGDKVLILANIVKIQKKSTQKFNFVCRKFSVFKTSNFFEYFWKLPIFLLEHQYNVFWEVPAFIHSADGWDRLTNVQKEKRVKFSRKYANHNWHRTLMTDESDFLLC